MDMELTTALDAFLTAKTASVRSERTIEKYQDTITRFIDYIGDKSLEQLQPEDIEQWMTDRRKAGLLPNSLLTYYQSIATWLHWCQKRYRLTYNPIDLVDRPRIPKRLPSYLPDNEVPALLSATERLVNQVKAKAVIRFMLDTGARSGEIVGLRREDVDFQNKEVKLYGKDQEERLVPLGDKTIAAIRLYWGGRIDTYPCAFHGYKGAFTTAGIRSLIRRAAHFAGITHRVYPHLLRHTFAHNWIVGGGDVESLRRVLGHSSLSTTQKYSGMSIDDIKAKHQRIRPADKF